MNQESKHDWVNWIAATLFVIALAFFGFMAVSGYAWVILSIPDFAFWSILLTFLIAVSAGAIATYSFVSFAKKRAMRSLMFILLGANFILWVFLYLVTHPASIEWAVQFASRERNRTLVMAYVFIFIPCILLGSFTGDVKLSRPSATLLIIWGMVVMPIISLWLFFSPEPVFTLTSPEGGVEGLTPIGIVLSFSYLIAQFAAAFRLGYVWLKTREPLDLSLLLTIILWIIGSLFAIILWDPLQIAELLWMTAIISGFLLIAAVQFIKSVIQPHRELESLVEQRTRELELSDQESEFYLNLWTHKMGNILQGIVSYLDLLEHVTQQELDDQGASSVTRELSREAILVNHQVLQLSKIKERYHHPLTQIDVTKAISRAIETATELLGKDVFVINFTYDERIIVKGDDLIDLVFLSAIIFHVRNKLDEKIVLAISSEEFETTQSVFIKCRGKPMSKEIQEFVHSDKIIGSVSLDLDLFTIKLLMNRYNGSINFQRDDVNEENTFIIRFGAT